MFDWIGLVFDVHSSVLQFVDDLNDPLVFTVVASVIFLCLALLLRVNIGSRLVHIVVLLGMGMLVYHFSFSLDGSKHEFFFNLSTELFGAFIAVLLIHDLLDDQPLMMFAFAFFLIIGLPLMLEVMPLPFIDRATSGEFFINLRTDLLGAFIVFVLMNELVFNDGQSRWQRMKKNRLAAAQNKLDTLRAERERMESQMRKLKAASHEKWDVIIGLWCKSHDELQAKLNGLNALLSPVGAPRRIIERGGFYYYTLASVRPLPPVHQSQPNQVRLMLEGSSACNQHVVETMCEVFEIADESINEFIDDAEGDSSRIHITIVDQEIGFMQSLSDKLCRRLWQRAKRIKNDNTYADNETFSDDLQLGLYRGYCRAITDLKRLMQESHVEVITTEPPPKCQQIAPRLLSALRPASGSSRVH